MKAVTFALALAIGLLGLCGGASAYTLKTLYSFCSGGGNCLDGDGPNPIIMDAAGNIYGTTTEGGKHGRGGVVYELIPNAEKSAWAYVQLHALCAVHGCLDGRSPRGKLVVDAAGALYGTTTVGGANLAKDWSGTVFKLTPNGDRSHWDVTTLYDFCNLKHCKDGATPYAGLTYVGQASGAPYDGHSPLFGVTELGGSSWQVVGGNIGTGVLFELLTKRGALVERVIHNFCTQSGCTDGRNPIGGLLADADATLYGATSGGTGINGSGTLYSLSHGTGRSWNHTVLYNFCQTAGYPDGAFPNGDLILDSTGNLLGITGGGGTSAFCPFSSQGCGTVFKLVPDGASSVESVLHTFCQQANCTDGAAPVTGLSMGAGGELFGVTGSGGNSGTVQFGAGTAFSLNGAFNLVYAFCAQTNCTDGSNPGSIIVDADGNLFGTTGLGGAFGHGSIFELSP